MTALEALAAKPQHQAGILATYTNYVSYSKKKEACGPTSSSKCAG